MMHQLRSWFGRRLHGSRAPIREIPPYYLLLDDEYCPWCGVALDDTRHYPYCSADCGHQSAADNRRD